jgi:uncharacterized protein Yka (UPF0111/DUF47 family)
MITNDALKNLALDINDSLSAYIVIHDTLNKKSNSIFSIFKKIDFEKLTSQSESILVRLKSTSEEITLAEKNANVTQKEFVECLSDYTNALIETNNLFHTMLDYLRVAATAGGDRSFGKHMQNNKAYQESIKNYMQYGDKLNSLYRQL